MGVIIYWKKEIGTFSSFILTYQHLQSSESPAGDIGRTVSSDNRSSLEHKLVWRLRARWVYINDRPLVRLHKISYILAIHIFAPRS